MTDNDANRCFCRDGVVENRWDHWPTCPKYGPKLSEADRADLAAEHGRLRNSPIRPAVLAEPASSPGSGRCMDGAYQTGWRCDCRAFLPPEDDA